MHPKSQCQCVVRRHQKHQSNFLIKPSPSKTSLYLFAAELVVAVSIDLFEHVGWWWSISDVDEFNLEHEGGTSWDDVSSSSVTVAETWRDGEFSLFADTHVEETLVPTLDHLAHSQFEREGLVSVEAAKENMVNFERIFAFLKQ